MGVVTFITWKGDLLMLGDADGNLNIWDLKGKASRQVICNSENRFHFVTIVVYVLNFALKICIKNMPASLSNESALAVFFAFFCRPFLISACDQICTLTLTVNLYASSLTFNLYSSNCTFIH